MENRINPPDELSASEYPRSTNIPDRHRVEVRARVTVILDRRLIDGQKPERLTS
jgi:hypothetical protein